MSEAEFLRACRADSSDGGSSIAGSALLAAFLAAVTAGILTSLALGAIPAVADDRGAAPAVEGSTVAPATVKTVGQLDRRLSRRLRRPSTGPAAATESAAGTGDGRAGATRPPPATRRPSPRTTV